MTHENRYQGGHSFTAASIERGDALYRQHLSISNPMNFLDKALNEYARAVEAEAASPSLLGKMAQAELQKGNLEKAARLADKALSGNSKEMSANHVKGNILYKQGSHEESLRYMYRALRYSGLSNTYLRLGLIRAHMHQAREGGEPVLDRLWHYVLGFHHLVFAGLLYAFETDKVPVKQLAHLLPRLLLGCYREDTGNLDAALKVFLKLHDRFPGMAEITNLIGDVYRKKNHADEALYWYRKTATRHPANEDAWFHIAQILEDKNQFDEVIAIYHRLMALRPNDPHLLCNLANAHYAKNEIDQALVMYQTAMTLSDDRKWKALLAQSIGNLYHDCYQQPEAAKAAYRLAIELNPDEADNYIQLGLLYYKSEDTVNARKIYESALKIDPRNPRLYSNLGYLCWMEDDLAQAVTYYEKAIGIDPFYEIPYNNLGVICLDALGNVHRAVELLEKAVSLNENYALAYYNLGRAFSFMDKRPEAATNFRMAQQLNEFTRELDNEELTARINYLFNTIDS